MSLLLCFFVMLYAVSTLEVPKMQAAVESFRGGFGSLGSLSVKDRQTGIGGQRGGTAAGFEQGGQPITAVQVNKTGVQTTSFEENSIKGGLIRFEPGSDELDDQAKRELNALVKELADSPFKIQVTGHAGIGERGMYRDPMDLSYSRAVNVWRYLVSRGLNRDDFRINAVGSSEPLDSEYGNTVVEINLLDNVIREQ
jgi:chemotaxis protein MotB